MHAHAHIHTRIHTCTHTHMHTRAHASNKNDYPCEFDKKPNRSTEKQTKIEEESKMPMKNFAANFPY